MQITAALSLLSCAQALSLQNGQVTYNVLVAGYGPFMEYNPNPAAQTALALDDKCYTMKDLLPEAFADATSRVCYVGWNVTVDHIGASQVQHALEEGSIQRAGIDAIIHLGLEDGAKGLFVETVGANLLAEPSFEGEKIEPFGPAVNPVTIDLGRLDITQAALAPIVAAENRAAAAAARAAGRNVDKNKTVEEAWSRDAGEFYCNEALYRTTYTVRRLMARAPGSESGGRRLLLPALFVHLPNATVAPYDTVLVPAIASLGAAVLVDDMGPV